MHESGVDGVRHPRNGSLIIALKLEAKRVCLSERRLGS